MGYYNQYNIKNMSDSGKFNYLKKFMQVLLSVSLLFSLVFSQSSLIPVFLHSFDYFVSKFSIKFFTYNTERNYIFLLCNGILVLIIRNSGLISKSPVRNYISKGAGGGGGGGGGGSGGGDTQQEKIAHDSPKFQETKVKIMGKVEGKGREIGVFVAASKEDFQSFENIEELEVEEIDGDDNDDEVLSTDELNKKCEDFIKKVKQEIQSEEFPHPMIIT